MVFFAESWFWRGTQSAIFYYASCTPWAEHKHKKKRRREAEKARKDRDDNIVYTQPGVVRQPAPFQTNEEWAQEIVRGPGPPKGWKRDPLYYKYVRQLKDDIDRDATTTRPRNETVSSTASPVKSDWTASTDASTTVVSLQRPPDIYIAKDTTHGLLQPHTTTLGYGGADGSLDTFSEFSSTAVDSRPSVSPDASRDLFVPPSRGTDTTGVRRASFESELSEEREIKAPRPSMERRLSSAVDGLKGAMRSALHSDRWNWIRYERDDEILSGLNEKVKEMWGSVRERVVSYGEDAQLKLRQADTQDSAEMEAKRWQRGKHPAINEMHPPVVSQLPFSRDEARWMLLPPASANVMMGRVRPDPVKDIQREPLCIIGRPPPVAQRMPSIGSQSASSEEEQDPASDSDDHEWMHGWTHIQRPQLPHLWRQRASYML
ncbi:hypothetical protein LTS08_007633 [Lithohypha guttulata]|nr:hypothetical protein LTS08_007633 [Lithohypha guttulata]